jgi:hypothetical protein
MAHVSFRSYIESMAATAKEMINGREISGIVTTPNDEDLIIVLPLDYGRVYYIRVSTIEDNGETYLKYTEGRIPSFDVRHPIKAEHIHELEFEEKFSILANKYEIVRTIQMMMENAIRRYIAELNSCPQK